MADPDAVAEAPAPEAREVRAEMRHVPNSLGHSLAPRREIFLRELISNAADALNRLRCEQLTNQDVRDPAAELGIWITFDQESRILRVTDTGIGLTRDEMIENLGTIAQSGAMR